MGDDPFKESRDNAAGFGRKVEDAAESAGEALRQLQGKDESTPEHKQGDVNVHVDVDVNR
jgi:hypothetical protein